MSRRAPQPQRFDRFVELRDGSGFTIPGCSHVFKFDRHRGWFDEHGNYYDRDGNPEDPPSSADGSDRSFSHSDGEEDEFEREFGGPGRLEEGEGEEAEGVRQLGRIAANMEQLGLYPCKEPLRVHFRNLHYFSRREDVFRRAAEKAPGILNLVFFHNERGQFNGKGYFVVANVLAAEELVKLEGERFGDREVTFEVPEVQEFLLEPLRPHQTRCDFAPKTAQNYSSKTEQKAVSSNSFKQPARTAPLEVKPLPVEARPDPEEVKPAPVAKQAPLAKEEPKAGKTEEPKAHKAELDPEGFCTYTFLKKTFPNKTSFKEWLSANNFGSSDYQAVEKIVGREDYARVTMKRKVFLALNNAVYNGEKIVFAPE